MVFSNELILRCFPHKEAILFNLNVAVELAASRDSVEDFDRIDHLCKCHEFLRIGSIDKAENSATMAGYRLMAEAIQYHFATKK